MWIIETNPRYLYLIVIIYALNSLKIFVIQKIGIYFTFAFGFQYYLNKEDDFHDHKKDKTQIRNSTRP